MVDLRRLREFSVSSQRDRYRNAFVGREALLRELDRCFERHLTTVVGPPGVGKTRLVDEWARSNCGRPTHRIALAPLSTREEIAHAIADGRRDALLILDNAEHVAVALGEAWLLWSAEYPDARALVTSRARLGLAGEEVMRLAPLDGQDAATLWRERAREHTGREALLSGAAGLLLARLQGLPLAIEVVVSRLSTYSAADLLHHFELVLNATVEDPSSDEPRSLVDALAASWRLLAQEERRALACAALTVGGFDDAFVDHVLAKNAAEARRHCRSLVEQSLLTRNGERIDILESVREFSLSAIDLETKRDAQHAFVRYFSLRFAAGADDGAVAAVDSIRRERGNGLRALALASDLGVPREAEPIAKRFANSRVIDGMPLAVVAEVNRWLSGVAEKPRLTLVAHETLTEGYRRAGEVALAFASAGRWRTCAVLNDDEDALLRAELRAATLRAECGLLDGVAPMLSSVADEAERRGHTRLAAEARTNLGFVGVELGDHSLALGCFARASASETPAFERTFAEIGLAITLAQLGRDDEARSQLAVTPTNDETSLTIFAACLAARLAMRDGDADGALAAIDGGVRTADSARRPWVRLLSRVVRAEILIELGARSADADLGWIEATLERLPIRGRVVPYAARLRLAYAASMGTVMEIDVAHRRCLEGDSSQTGIADLYRELGMLRWHACQLKLTAAEQALLALRGGSDKTVEQRATIATLERLLAECATPCELLHAVVVDVNGAYLQRGARVDLTKHPKPARLLGALARDHVRAGGGLSYEDLVSVGWAGERISEAARRNRFDVSLSRLRGLGLRDLLVFRASRYRLASDCWWIVTGSHDTLVRRREQDG